MTNEELIQCLTPSRTSIRRAALELDSDIIINDNDNVVLYTSTFTLKASERDRPIQDIANLHVLPALYSIVREMDKRNKDGEFGDPFMCVDSESNDGVVFKLYFPVRELPATVGVL